MKIFKKMKWRFSVTINLGEAASNILRYCLKNVILISSEFNQID